MNRNTLWGTFAAILLLVLAGLVSQEEASSISSLQSVQQLSTAPKLIASKPEPHISQLLEANNRFSFNLFNQLRLQQESQSSNILISPQSMAIALAMTRNGTAGATQTEMTRILELGQLDPTTVDLSYNQLIKTLKNADPSLELAIANSLWVNQNISLNQQFIQNAQDFYQGKVSNLNFADPGAKKTINQWVASNTAHKIPQIVDVVSPDDALYLLNATYFKGSWTNKFDPNATTPKPFYSDPKQTKPVAMMSQTGDYRYYQTQDFQAIRLPYGKQGELGMYIFLPQKNSNLEQFHQQLNLANWQEWLSQMRSQPGNVSLPKFKLAYETELKDVLFSLGMGEVFDATQADFSALTDSPVALNTVKHKAVIEVNEEGTEAAGGTAIGIRITSAVPQNQTFEMNIDRPFFFAIRDDITETILFMGDVVEIR